MGKHTRVRLTLEVSFTTCSQIEVNRSLCCVSTYQSDDYTSLEEVPNFDERHSLVCEARSGSGIAIDCGMWGSLPSFSNVMPPPRMLTVNIESIRIVFTTQIRPHIIQGRQSVCMTRLRLNRGRVSQGFPEIIDCVDLFLRTGVMDRLGNGHRPAYCAPWSTLLLGSRHTDKVSGCRAVVFEKYKTTSCPKTKTSVSHLHISS
ncbi:hypothetical protein GALMADRAFT_1169452 [Galerina marginata CBS 339.88]|uniref:Uncharacterized protein n=1 Tax=Galerina marginata (strain CBS 339.88) TaxID=685588 RepID=A0A067TLT9_GALM3|nr:hypothetical protein GALMADRAFT_1169452 [Galerina marginata CBS 339.88]